MGVRKIITIIIINFRTNLKINADITVGVRISFQRLEFQNLHRPDNVHYQGPLLLDYSFVTDTYIHLPCDKSQHLLRSGAKEMGCQYVAMVTPGLC